jgi:hypothetical protein
VVGFFEHGNESLDSVKSKLLDQLSNYHPFTKGCVPWNWFNIELKTKDRYFAELSKVIHPLISN